MAYAEKKPLMRCYGLQGMGNQRDGAKAPSTTERQAPELGEDTVYSPDKYRETEGRKDIKGYSVTGGKGTITGTDDSGVAFSIVNNATIRYRPGYLDDGFSFPEGVYNAYGAKILNGPVTIYKKTHLHTGFLQFVTSGGSVLLDGNFGLRSISFNAGSAPSVTPEYSDPITVLAQSGSTAIQNFAFDGMEDIN